MPQSPFPRGGWHRFVVPVAALSTPCYAPPQRRLPISPHHTGLRTPSPNPRHDLDSTTVYPVPRQGRGTPCVRRKHIVASRSNDGMYGIAGETHPSACFSSSCHTSSARISKNSAFARTGSIANGLQQSTSGSSGDCAQASKLLSCLDGRVTLLIPNSPSKGAWRGDTDMTNYALLELFQTRYICVIQLYL